MDGQAKKYQKIKLIGEGTFGKAWLVKSLRSGRSYVTKEVNLKGMKQQERLQAANEVAILSRLKHNNVIRYREAFTSSGVLHIIMEYADQGDLAQRLAHRRRNSGFGFSEEQALDWTVQICFALSYIHEQKILHRDLKPANIFLTSTNLLKVGDFGIAKKLTNTLDQARTAIGTPYYLSPEICRRKPYNQKSDIWAVGCILYELVTLRHPFEAKDFSSLVVNILRGKYQSIPSEYSAIIEDLISVLLRVRPDKRPSASQILQVPSLNHSVTLYTNRKHESVTSSQGIHTAMSAKSQSSMEKVLVKRRKRLNGISNDDVDSLNHGEISMHEKTRLSSGKVTLSKKSQIQTTKQLISPKKTAVKVFHDGNKNETEKREIVAEDDANMNFTKNFPKQKEKSSIVLTADKSRSVRVSNYMAPSHIPCKKTYVLTKDGEVGQNINFSFESKYTEKYIYRNCNHRMAHMNEKVTKVSGQQSISENCYEVGVKGRLACNQLDEETTNNSQADRNVSSCKPVVSSPDSSQTMEIAEMMHAGTPVEGENTGSVRGRLESIRLYLEEQVGTTNCVKALQCFAEMNESEKLVTKMRDRIGSRNMRYFPMLLQVWDLENRYH